MRTFHQVVKAFAILMAVLIIAGIARLAMGLLGFLGDYQGGFSKGSKLIITERFERDYENIKHLDLESTIVDVTVKKGDSFKLDGYNIDDYFKTTVDGDRLIIKAIKKKFWFNNWKRQRRNLTIYVNALETLELAAGASKTNVESIDVEKARISMGAGSLVIDDSQFRTVRIDGGAGSIRVNNSILNDLVLNSGVGSVKLNAKLSGQAKINNGIGSLRLDLHGTKEDYEIRVSKGIGSVTIDGDKIKDNDVFGSGYNKIVIDGGIGSTKINFIR